MSWEDLLNRLQELQKIHPEKMQETAVFYSELDSLNYIIDETEYVDMDESGLDWDCNVGDEDMKITFALIP